MINTKLEWCVIPSPRTRAKKHKARLWRVEEIIRNRKYKFIKVFQEAGKWYPADKGEWYNGIMFTTSHDIKDIQNWIGYPESYEVFAGGLHEGKRKMVIKVK